MATSISDSDTVFIDTNLDTHLALTVSDHDTVSDIKKLIVSEHHSCFPKIGQIQIHGIKVKRKGQFYHLSDSMVLRRVFIGVKKIWFLSVDVSALEDSRLDEKLLPHDSLRQVESIGIVNNALVGSGSDNNGIILPCNSQLLLLESKKDERERVHIVSPCVSKHTAKEAVANMENGVKLLGDNDTAIPLLCSNSKTDDRRRLNNEVPGLPMKCEVDGLDKGNKDDDNVGVEESSMSVQSGKRKRKSKRKREEIPSDRLRVAEQNEKDAVKNLEMVPSLNIECEVDGPDGGNKNDHNVYEEPPSISVPNAKRRNKSTKKKEATVVGDRSKDNIVSVDNPLDCPSVRASSFNNFQVSQSNNIKDEKEEILFDLPCEVDGSDKGIKGDSIVCEKGTSKSVQSAKKKHKSVRKKEDTVRDDTLKERATSVVVPVKRNIVLAIAIFAEKRKRCPTHNSKEPLKGDTSSQKDEAQTADGAHEERKESEDIIINKTNLDKLEIGAVAYKESIQSRTKETGYNSKQGDIEMEVQSSDVNEPKDLMEDNKNVVGSHCHESEAGKIEGAGEGEVSPQNAHVFDSKKERDVHRIDKAPNAHKTQQATKFSSPSNSAMSSIVENRKYRNNASGKSMDLDKQREHIPISTAKLEGSNKMVQNKARKASGNNVMEVVSKSQQKKSLLEGAIFKDDSSSSSEDKGQEKVDNSDASTRTPSDNTHPSYLDGYDSPGVDSRQNGSYDGKRLENDERSPFKAKHNKNVN